MAYSDITFPPAPRGASLELFNDECITFDFVTGNTSVGQIIHIFSFTPQQIDSHLSADQAQFITDVIGVIRTHGPRIAIDHYCRLASVPLPIAPEGYSFRAIGLNRFLLIHDEAGISVATIEADFSRYSVTERTWVCVPEISEEGLDEEMLTVFLCVIKSFNANEQGAEHDA